jgi:hypothetical protein
LTKRLARSSDGEVGKGQARNGDNRLHIEVLVNK